MCPTIRGGTLVWIEKWNEAMTKDRRTENRDRGAEELLSPLESEPRSGRLGLFRVSALPYVLLGVIGALTLPLVILFASAGQIARSGDSAILLFAVPAFVVALGFAGLIFLLGRD